MPPGAKHYGFLSFEEPVADIHEVADVLRRKRVGDRVWVEFVRNGEIHRMEAILKPRPK